MYKVYCDGSLLYDPRVDELAIVGPKLELEVNRKGSFSFTMYDTHPLYGSIRKLKSVIEVYQDSAMIFRGRPLNDDIDTHNGITYQCEGDLAMFNDSLVRPYSFQGSVTDYLQKLITDHNAQVEVGKQFTLGTVTVTDPNDFITRASSDYPKTWTEIEKKLLDILGGYIVVRRSGGVNYIDYLKDSTYRSDQVIRLGENLLKVKQERRSEDIATAIIPVGAELEDEEGVKYRVDITSVNDGVDYVHDQAAVDQYGWIFKMIRFDDVTLPANLLTKANQALAQSILLLNTIELTAVDLSMMDINIDEFRIFEYVQVESPAHQLDDLYLIQKMTVNLLRPENNTITVGVQYTSFTEKQYQTDKTIEVIQVKTEELGQEIIDSVNNISKTLTNSIQESAEAVTRTMAETYTTKTELETYKETVSLAISQTAEDFNLEFTNYDERLTTIDGDTKTEFQEIKKHIRFIDGKIVLGQANNPFILEIRNDRISFLQSGVEVAYLSNEADTQKLYINDGQILKSLRIGNFAFVPRQNGNLSFRKVT